MAKVILIANQKGGVGKSTIATTLGTGLKRQGYTVLMLDADTQQSLSKWRASAEGLPHEADIPWVERWDSPLIAEKIQKEHAHYDFIIIDSASLGKLFRDRQAVSYTHLTLPTSDLV